MKSQLRGTAVILRGILAPRLNRTNSFHVYREAEPERLAFVIPNAGGTV